MAMTTTTSKKNPKAVLLVGSLLLLLIIGNLGYTYMKRSTDKKLYETKQNEARKLLMWDMWNSYNLLRSNARLWNSSYAALSLDITRDTIAYEKYTKSDFILKHKTLMTTGQIFKTDVFNINRFHINQLAEMHPNSYEFQNIVGTSRLREELYTNFDLLDQEFMAIIRTIKETDTIATNTSTTKPEFYRYFEILARMDAIYIDLLRFRYEEDLAFVMEHYPEFKDESVRRVFEAQRLQLRDDHNDLKKTDEFISIEEKVYRCAAPEVDSLTTYTLQSNGNKTLLMIQTEQPMKVDNPKEKINFVQTVIGCVKDDFDDFRNPDYIYMVTPEHQLYFKSDMASENSLQILPTDERTFFSFYNDASNGYWIRGSYDPYRVFYPHGMKQGEAEI